MFAKTIVLSDAFLDMPLSARCLYFTLGMLADDDGFINSPKSIMRQCGAAQDDMNILLARKFIIAFDSGVIVIKHWRINNYLRSDRHTETKYLDEMATLSIDEKGEYTHVGIPTANQLPTMCQPDGIPSIGKDSKGEERIGKDNTLIEGCVVNLARETPTPSQSEYKPLKPSDRVKALNLPKILEDAALEWLKYKYSRHELPQGIELDALLHLITQKANDAGAEAVAEIIKTSIASGYKAIVFDRIKPVEKKTGSSRLEDHEKLDDINAELDAAYEKITGGF